ncbi:ArsR family transcriptional regulator [Pontibacillus halophilus JSM 076056 = DSM 19796]|uniref:ArsR family transcriptional regulator n=1 Tax=Pontibacillus halophilus JSM 076056 = DSM 19796 TaxID=1385510 RepID=A0A0A5GIW4_9BACI|nr:metalloregulator ArsR/SmtB family transcription factor [Pontibacillus halophilus]KGX91080.1 ArsR family transcriptional regulator [Pontibacillus halophilus JSM 076056 = DSM 19796]
MKNEKALDLFSQCTPVFNAFGDPARQEIILALAQKEKMSVKEIREHSNLSHPAISHHLKILRENSIVEFEKVGTQRFYRLTIGESVELIKSLVAEVEDVCDL